LKRMLKDIERTLQFDASRQLMAGSDAYMHSMPGTSNTTLPSSTTTIYLHSPSKSSSGQLSRHASGMTSFGVGNESATSGITIAQVQHHMRELENPNFVYEPLFSNANRDKIRNLMTVITTAKEEMSGLIQITDEQSRTPLSWFDKLFRNDSVAAKEQQQVASLAEKHKTVNFLGQSRTALSKLFDLPAPDLSDSAYDYSLDESFRQPTPSMSSFNSRDIPDQTHISPKGKFNEVIVRPMGNPDLAPLRSDEQPYLIPHLVSMSRGLNHAVLPFIESVYYRDDWKGKFTRALVSKPAYYMEQEKLGPGQVTRVKKYLPPRINLRFMGSNYFSGVLLGVFLLGLLFGVSGFGWILWPTLTVLFYGVIRAILEPPNHLLNLIAEFEGSLHLGSNFQYDAYPSDDNPLINDD